MNVRLNTHVSARRLLPNGWDVIAFPLIIGLIAMMAIGLHQTLQPIVTLKTQAISLDPANLPEYALRTTLRMLVAMVARWHSRWSMAPGRQEPARRKCWCQSSISCSRCRYSATSLSPSPFHRAVPRPGAGGRAGGDVRHLHQPGVEYDLQLLPVAAHRAARSASGTRVSPQPVATFLEAGCAVRHAGADLEHDDVDVRRLVLYRGVGSDHRRQQHLYAAGHRRVSRAGDPQRDLPAIGWVLLTMTVVIPAYDQLLFRPLVAWADKFRMETTRSASAPTSGC